MSSGHSGIKVQIKNRKLSGKSPHIWKVNDAFQVSENKPKGKLENVIYQMK